MNLFTAHSKINKKKSGQSGFTLVEMIVSLGIFTIVALVAVGALLKITDANKKSQSLKTAINNLNFALESMSREMRVGESYHCYTGVISPDITFSSMFDKYCDPQSSNWAVAFESSKIFVMPNNSKCNLVHAYWHVPVAPGVYTIKKAEQVDCNQTSFSNGDFYPLLTPEINIIASQFRVDVPDNSPPKVFFWLKGNVGVRERDTTEFEVQTTISQRN